VLTNALQTATKLKYFSDYHLHIEEAHEMFETKMEQQLLSIPMPPQVHADAIALVDRAYTAFESMFHGLREELEPRCTLPTGSAPAKSTSPEPSSWNEAVAV